MVLEVKLVKALLDDSQVCLVDCVQDNCTTARLWLRVCRLTSSVGCLGELVAEWKVSPNNHIVVELGALSAGDGELNVLGSGLSV